MSLRNNQLKALPPQIRQLTALKEFSAAQNQLKELPDIFGAFRGPAERAKARHKRGEIEVVPVVLYPMDLKHDCEFLYQLNPLPAWGKSWRDFEKDGDWNDALYPIGNGVKQAIEKARLRC